MKERLRLPTFAEQLRELDRIEPSILSEIVSPIVFDTNFLFITFDYDIDVIRELQGQLGSELSLFISEGTLKELRDMYDAKKRSRKFFGLVLTFIKKYNIRVLASKETYVDNVLVELAHDYKIYIATSDKGLKRRIKDTDSKIIYLRQKSYLEID